MAAEYKARERYQDQGIASNYDEVRFQSWHGRLSHRIEEAGLDAAIKKYFSRPGNILDLPCGTGRLFPVMINQGFDVVGGDGLGHQRHSASIVSTPALVNGPT